MPKKMKYVTSGIVNLAADLADSATMLQEKRRQAGDACKLINGELEVASDVALLSRGELPGIEWYTNSRLIILGHGNATDMVIAGQDQQGARRWSPRELAAEAGAWVEGNKIKQISLHMCFGGGDSSNSITYDDDVDAYLNSFAKHPRDSFAFAFASYCDFSTTVTARTHITRMNQRRRGPNGDFVTAWRTVGPSAAPRYKRTGDKMTFTPQGGTLNRPVDPVITFELHAVPRPIPTH